MGACTTFQSLQGSVRNLKGFEKISKVSWSLRIAGLLCRV